MSKIFENPWVNITQVETAFESLQQEATILVEKMPKTKDIVRLIAKIPEEDFPLLIPQLKTVIDDNSALRRIFKSDEIDEIIKNPSAYRVKEARQDGVLGTTTASGEIRMTDDDLNLAREEVLSKILLKGTFGTTTLEHEWAHKLAFERDTGLLEHFQMLDDLLEDLQGTESYATARELHEVFARSQSIEECCGSLNWVGGEDSAWEKSMFTQEAWGYYGKDGTSIDLKKVHRAYEDIFTCLLFQDPAHVVRAIADHGAYDETTGTYAGIERLIGEIPLEDRELYANTYRLYVQTERLKATKAAREFVVNEYSKS